MQLDVVVTASHGCAHAGTVLDAVRQQRQAGDRIIVVEPHPCADSAGDSTGEEHIVGSADDFESRIEGLRRSSGDAVLVLEDHGVPGEGFVDCLRDLLDGDHAPGAVTFWMRNGTADDAPSRALFAFVAGAADPQRGGARPGIVASSFALGGRLLAECREASAEGRLGPGELEYEWVPAALADATTPVPRALVLLHCQRNTVREAYAATYWNARHSGWVERDRDLAGGPIRHILRRYPGRSYRVLTSSRPSLAEAGVVIGMGAVGLVGWWVGRYRGAGPAAERLRDVHPVPARS